MQHINPQYIPSPGTRIRRFVAVPTKRSYNDIYQRSFEVKANYNDLTKLESIFAQHNVHNNQPLTDLTLAMCMPEVMSISDHTTGKVEIPYGWGTQRLRFLMEVETDLGGMIISSYLQGYSEYSDPSMFGKVDPNMNFYINGLTVVHRMIDPITHQQVVVPKTSYNVVTDLAGGARYSEVDLFNSTSNNLKLVRPVDVLEDIQMGEMYGNTPTYNTTGSIGNGANLSARANNDSIKYFTKTINGIITGKALTGNNEDMTNVMSNAVGQVTEDMLNDNPFISELGRITGEITPTSFTLNVLDKMDPNVVLDMVGGSNSIGIVDFTHAILDTEHTAAMLQPTIETKIATLVAHSMSSMLAENMLTGISLSMTNMSGMAVAGYTKIESFIPGVNHIAYVNKLLARVENILMPEITYNNQLLVEIHVIADLIGDTTVAVSLNMQPLVPFRFPTFSDGLYTPVISDTAHRALLSNNIGNIIDKTYNSNQPQY